MDAILTRWGPVSAMKLCPFRDCKAEIGNDDFACLRHRYHLDPGQRHIVDGARYDFGQGRITAERLAEIERAMVAKVQGKRLF